MHLNLICSMSTAKIASACAFYVAGSRRSKREEKCKEIMVHFS